MNIICEQNGLKFEGISCRNRYERFYVPKFVLKIRDDHFSLIDSKGNVETIPFAGIEEVNLCGQVYPNIDLFEAAFQDIIYTYNSINSDQVINKSDIEGDTVTDALNNSIEILFFDNFAAFPVAGVDNKIYIDKATNLSYRWNGASYVLVGDGTGAIAQVTDETDRDSTYPAPANEFQIYNQRTNNVETYYTALGLWLSSDMVVMISESVTILVDRLVYVGGFYTALGFSYATVLYPTNTTFDNRTIGVVVQDGVAIDAARRFIAVAVNNQYYVDYGEAIAVGEFVYAKTTGINADLGFASGSVGSATGRIGVAFQNSGQTPGFATKVLVKIGVVSESF